MLADALADACHAVERGYALHDAPSSSDPESSRAPFAEAQARSLALSESYMVRFAEQAWTDFLASESVVTDSTNGPELTVHSIRKPLTEWTLGEFMDTADRAFWVDQSTFELKHEALRHWLTQTFRCVVGYNNLRVKYLDVDHREIDG